MRLHPAKDREGTKLNLSVAHTGVLVFQVELNKHQIHIVLLKRELFLLRDADRLRS